MAHGKPQAPPTMGCLCPRAASTGSGLWLRVFAIRAHCNSAVTQSTFPYRGGSPVAGRSTEPPEVGNLLVASALPPESCVFLCLLIWKLRINPPLSGAISVAHPGTQPVGKFRTHISCSVISNECYFCCSILILSLGLSSRACGPSGQELPWKSGSEFPLREGCRAGGGRAAGQEAKFTFSELSLLTRVGKRSIFILLPPL